MTLASRVRIFSESRAPWCEGVGEVDESTWGSSLNPNKKWIGTDLPRRAHYSLEARPRIIVKPPVLALVERQRMGSPPVGESSHSSPQVAGKCSSGATVSAKSMVGGMYGGKFPWASDGLG